MHEICYWEIHCRTEDFFFPGILPSSALTADPLFCCFLNFGFYATLSCLFVFIFFLKKIWTNCVSVDIPACNQRGGKSTSWDWTLWPSLCLGSRTAQQFAWKITQEEICTIKLQMKRLPGHRLYQLLCSASCLKGIRNHEVGKSIKMLPEDNK